MKYQIDLLLGGILLAILMAALTPARSTSLQFSGGEVTSFSESYLLTASRVPEVTPQTYQELSKLGRIAVGQHVVEEKETLASLAKDYGSKADFLRSTNRLDDVKLAPGKTLLVHNGMGMIHQVRET